MLTPHFSITKSKCKSTSKYSAAGFTTEKFVTKNAVLPIRPPRMRMKLELFQKLLCTRKQPHELN